MFDIKEKRAISKAMQILESKSLYIEGTQTSSLEVARDICRFLVQNSRIEKFGVLFLNAQNRLITKKVMFEGTVNVASVYVREIVREALIVDAVSVIVTHNHPSGNQTPSLADDTVTKKIKTALNIVELELLDHIIIGKGDACYSYAQDRKL